MWKNLTNLSTCRLGKDLRDSAGNSRNFVGAVNKLFQYRASTLRETRIGSANAREMCKRELDEQEQDEQMNDGERQTKPNLIRLK